MGRRNLDNCFSKTQYETYEDAQSTADYLLDTEGIKLYVYKCPLCQKYHLTKRRTK